MFICVNRYIHTHTHKFTLIYYLLKEKELKVERLFPRAMIRWVCLMSLKHSHVIDSAYLLPASHLPPVYWILEQYLFMWWSFVDASFSILIILPADAGLTNTFPTQCPLKLEMAWPQAFIVDCSSVMWQRSFFILKPVKGDPRSPGGA